ncbi:putative ribonuclease H-like domain-containing protein [Tanacetum coccineum]|uniref:Ribonuclease H-like domain-containing protein n=1 Tax=Tanacetum coccineum TaxID=301880 RepID=A0ABQ5I486_9ASTR
MKHYLGRFVPDYPIWEVIQRGNGLVSVSTDTNGVIKVLPPKTAKEILAREKERKARTTLLMALPEDHLAKFYKIIAVKEMWEAIKSRFGGNDESKKMQKYILKQQFEGFSASPLKMQIRTPLGLYLLPGPHFLNHEDKPGVDSLSFDDLYNNLRVFESDVKGSTASSSSTQNVAFVSENTSSTNEVSTAYGASSSLDHKTPQGSLLSYTDELMYSFFANQSSGPQLDHEDLEQLDEFDLEEMDLKWQVAMISMRLKKFYKKTGRKLQFDAKEPVGFDKTKVECYNCHKTGHFARECRSKGNQDSRRRDAWNTGNKAKDNERRSGKQEEPKALVTLDGDGVDWTSHSEDEQENYALMAYSNSGSDTEEKIRFMKIDLDDKTDVLTYHKKLLAEAEKEKEELKAKVEKWHNSSKSLNILLNSQMSARDKAGLGYGDQMNKVPPPMIGIYIPSGPDKEIDDSQFTYSPKQSKPSEFDARNNDFNSCESNSSKETLESMPEPVVNEPKVSPKPNKKDCSGLMSKKLGLGYGFTKKAYFVCGSFSHLIRDCDFHEKRMAKQAELNKRMCKGTGQRENRPVWNNVQRVNHQNQFVPTAVLTRTGRIQVNTARASSTNNVNTARHNFNSQAVPTNAARKVHTVKPIVNNVRPKTIFHKTYSPIRRPFNRTTTPRTNFSNQKVNTAEVKAVSAVGGKRETADYPQRALKNKGIVDSGCSRHMIGKQGLLAEYQDYNGGPVAFRGSKGQITSKGKQHKASCKAKSVSSISQPLQLLHMDLFGPTSVRSLNHKTYCLVITDDFSRDFIEFYGSKGIKREYSNARTPQQNGVAERKNRTLIEAARTMLADSFLPNTFWAEAVSTACYVLNRVLVTKPQNKTPYELITGKGPTWLFNLDYLTDSMNYQPVRSENQANKQAGPKEATHSVVTKDNIDAGNSEIDAESAQDYFVLPIWSSYTSTVKSSKAKNTAEALRKEFAKDTEDLLLQAGAAKASSTNTVNTASTPVSTASPYGGLSFTDTDQDDSEIPALEDMYDYPTDGIFTNASYDDEHAVADFTNLETIVNVSPIPTSRINSIHPSTLILGDPNSAVQTRSKVTKSSGAHAFVSYIQKQRRNNHKDFQHCLFACFLSQNEPKKISEALEDKSWVDAMQEELLQFKIQKVWILVYLPYGKKAIGTKWVYSNKKDERGVVVRNKERIEAIRIFLAFSSYMGFIVYQMDVKSAFLYRKIDEEVYVSQPPGFVDPKYPKKVYKVVKALYGLHQAPRAWYATLSTFLLKSGYRRGTIDKTLFIKKDKNDIMLVQVYVDDIIFGSTKRSWCDEFEALMKSRFQMSSMGELTFFLGLQVKQKEDGIFISQDKYVAEILKKFDFASVKTASTPIETQKPLVKDEEASDVDVHLYRSMIGSLMYLTASRPDIMFAVCACSRFQVTPKTSHLNAVKRIFRYLKGKPKLGLWYPRVSSFDLEAYSDSDYAGANLDRKSTTGGCQFLGRRLISWQCKKQTIVATSTTEAEYVAAANCCGQVLWIQNQMLDYGFNFMNTKIYIDNESTICIVKNPVFHSKTKHIAIRHHFIRDAYEKKLIQVLKIHTDDNVADLLTKAFDVNSYLGFRESLERDIDGTEELLLPDLFILWLTKVSTDSAKLIPLGKDSTAIKTLEKIPPRV